MEMFFWRLLYSYGKITICIFLEGKSSEFFPINLGVAQGCRQSPILFFIYINGLLNVIEKCTVLHCRC